MSNYSIVPFFPQSLPRDNLLLDVTSFMTGSHDRTTAARFIARCANEFFCFAFKRAFPDVIQFDMVNANGSLLH